METRTDTPELLEIVKALYLWHKHYDGELSSCAPAVHAEQYLDTIGMKADLDKKADPAFDNLSELWEVVRNNVPLFKGSEADCFKFVLNRQSASVHHACKYDGYKFRPMVIHFGVATK